MSAASNVRDAIAAVGEARKRLKTFGYVAPEEKAERLAYILGQLDRALAALDNIGRDLCRVEERGAK